PGCRCSWRATAEKFATALTIQYSTTRASPQSRASEPPAQQYGADREPGADRGEQDEVALLQPAGTDRVVEREWNRRGGRVAEPLDVDDHLVRVDAELFGRRHDDPAVGLVRDEQIDVVRSEPVPVEQAAPDLLGLAHRELEHRLPVLLHVVQALVDGLVGRGPAAATGGHAQRPSAAAVGLLLQVDDRGFPVSRRPGPDPARAPPPP